MSIQLHHKLILTKFFRKQHYIRTAIKYGDCIVMGSGWFVVIDRTMNFAPYQNILRTMSVCVFIISISSLSTKGHSFFCWVKKRKNNLWDAAAGHYWKHTFKFSTEEKAITSTVIYKTNCQIHIRAVILQTRLVWLTFFLNIV